MGLTKSKLEQNLRQVRKNIAAACASARREPAEVTLVAVDQDHPDRAGALGCWSWA